MVLGGAVFVYAWCIGFSWITFVHASASQDAMAKHDTFLTVCTTYVPIPWQEVEHVALYGHKPRLCNYTSGNDALATL